MNATPEYEERILNARPDTDKFSFRKVDSKVSKVMQDRKLLEDIKTWASKLQREGDSSSLHVSIEREIRISTSVSGPAGLPKALFKTKHLGRLLRNFMVNR